MSGESVTATALRTMVIWQMYSTSIHVSSCFSSHTHYALEVNDNGRGSLYRANSWTPLYVNTGAIAYEQTNDDSTFSGSQGWYVYNFANRVVLRGYDFLKQCWIQSMEYIFGY